MTEPKTIFTRVNKDSFKDEPGEVDEDDIGANSPERRSLTLME